jgi:chromosome segregation ATPase
MTTYSTIVLPDSVEHAIQTLIQDTRLPNNLRTALALYRNKRTDVCTIGEKEIEISMWINDGSLDWSVEINGCRHEHVTSGVMEALIEGAVIAAEASLTRAVSHGLQ